MTIGGTRYYGTNCLSGVAATPETSIVLSSANWVHGSGWEVCGQAALTQHNRALAAGVDPAADPVCFTATYLTVPDDHWLTTSVGHGGWPSGVL